MSLLSLVTKEAPRWASGKLVMNFDAILEDTLEASVTLSDYPIEVGSRSNDHRIKNPIRWQMTGAISNNPLSVAVTDFTGLISEVSADNGVLSASAGLMAGWLSGDDETRSANALQDLLNLMYEGDPFDVIAGDVTLTGMVIESIRRTKTPQNESGLIFVAQLREWQDITLSVAAAANATNPTTGTQTASSTSEKLKKGQKAIEDAATSAKDTISGWFDQAGSFFK